jgi:peptidoglycan/LPS O-acetylase OafA/YrhL
MINPFLEVNWRPDATERRRFGRNLALWFPLAAGAILLIAKWRTGSWAQWPLWAAGSAASIGLACMALPAIAWPFYFLLNGLGCTIGFVVNHVVFTAIYYGAITPIGLLLRLFGKDPLERRIDRSATTYWKDAKPAGNASRYFRQF